MSQTLFESPTFGLDPAFAEPGVAGEPTAEAEAQQDQPCFEAHVAMIGVRLHQEVVKQARRKEPLPVDYAVAQGNFD